MPFYAALFDRKSWKAVVCLMLLAGVSHNAAAQKWLDAPKYHLGVRLGYMETNVRHDIHLFDGHGDMNCQSVTAGAAFDVKLTKIPFYLETGLYYSNRGVDVVDGSRRYARDNHSLLVPAMLSYHIYPGTNVSIQPFAGPFVAYNFGFEMPDYGLRLGCGVNYKQAYLNVGCDIGMRDNMFYNKEGFYEDDGNLTSIFVTVGWNFLGNR